MKKIGLLPVLSLSMAAISPASNAAESGLLTLEEVIVTVQRREESLQDTPVSVIAFNAENLTQQRIFGLGDLQGKVPSLNLTPFPSQHTSLRMFIRGVGASDIQVTQDPAVGIYIDGVYLGRSNGLAFDVVDLAQLEVLRGPQGTLFGRNSIGGAINMTTVGAELEVLSARQKVTIGDHNLRSSKTAVNIPIGDNAAARIAYLYRQQNGWFDNYGPGDDFYDSDDKGGKFDLRWDPAENLSATYSYDFSDVKAVSPTYQVLVPSPITDQFGIPVSEKPLNGLATQDPMQPATSDISGNSLTVLWELDAFTLKSITAYRELKYTEYTDLSSGAGTVGPILIPLNVTSTAGAELVGHDNILDQDQWSQEFQLLGDVGDNFEYVSGLYYFNESATQKSGSVFTVFFPQPPEINNFDIKNEAWAVYGQGTYTPAFNTDLGFTLGLRYTEDDRTASRFLQQGDVVVIDSSPDHSFQNVSTTVIVDYATSADINTYFKLATGYKSGGYNIRSSSAEAYNLGFDPEDLTTYELGLKSTWLQSRLRLNGAVYYSDYQDIQLNLNDLSTPANPTDTNVFNAGEAEIYGVELEFNAVLAEGLVANLTYGYMHAEFTNVDDPGDPFNDETNFVISNAPDNQYTVALDYIRPLGIGTLNANIYYDWVDDRYDTQRAEERDESILESNGLLGTYVAWTDIDLWKGTLTVAAWGKNLTDENYLTSAPVILQTAGIYNRIGTFGQPRSLGIDVIYEFQR
jgi:iron complex outermembrane receptor protein